MKGRTHYDTLGLSSTAGAEAIALAFKTLMRQLHPDVSRDPDSAREAAEVSAAYAVLSRPDRRAAYDRQLRTAWRRQLTGPPLVQLQPQRSRHVIRRRNPRAPVRAAKLMVAGSIGAASIVVLATHLQGRVEERALAVMPIGVAPAIDEAHAPAYVAEANARPVAAPASSRPTGGNAIEQQADDTRLAAIPAVDDADVASAARQVVDLVSDGRVEDARKLSVECRQSSVIEPHWRAQDFCVGLDLAGLIALDRAALLGDGDAAAYFRRVGGDATRHYAGLPAPQGEAETRADHIRDVVARSVVEKLPSPLARSHWETATATVANILSPAPRSEGRSGF